MSRRRDIEFEARALAHSSNEYLTNRRDFSYFPKKRDPPLSRNYGVHIQRRAEMRAKDIDRPGDATRVAARASPRARERRARGRRRRRRRWGCRKPPALDKRNANGGESSKGAEQEERWRMDSGRPLAEIHLRDGELADARANPAKVAGG